MPRGTTLRNVRVADDLWQRARAVAANRNESLSDVMRVALERYVKRHESITPPPRG
jgi:predicted transcriptional regulator